MTSARVFPLIRPAAPLSPPDTPPRPSNLMKKSSFLASALAVAVTCAPCAPPTAFAGNQHGPGWQQAKPKKKKAAPAAAEAPKARPVPETAPAPASALQVEGARTVPAAETLLRTLPGNGAVSEDELILLAITNSTRLARLRNEVSIAQARKLGAGDLPNPELRIGYAWDYDERLRSSYLERSTERITGSETYSRTQTARNSTTTEQEGTILDNYSESTAGRENRTRYRTIERRVTPGRYRDVTTTRVWESDSRSESSRSSRNGTSDGLAQTRSQEATDRRNSRLVEESREITQHPDDYSRDEELGVLVRFDVPNPWERRAKIEVAAAEIARAEAEYLAEEDKVIITVRELYEELTTLEGRRGATDNRRRTNEQYKSDIEKLNNPELADLAADVRLDISKGGLDSRELRTDIARVREELAVFCGLDNPDRISVSTRAVRRAVNTANLDLEYLSSVALLHRADLLDLQSRHQLAKAELREAKSLKIPFFTFLDAGVSKATTTQRSGENMEYMVRAGISLPLFDWVGINKAHKEFETASELYGKQIEEERRLIQVEIQQAINRIRAADKELGTFETELKQHREYAEISAKENAADAVKMLRTKQKGDDLTARFEENRYELWSDYSKAVLELERALGTRLDKALSGRVVGGGK